MAKGARASTTKANNARLKNRVFGPTEIARTERLSAKLLELAAQPRITQKKGGGLAINEGDGLGATNEDAPAMPDHSMDIDEAAPKESTKDTTSKGRIEKRKSSRSKASIVFPKYKEGKKVGLSRRKK